MEIKKNENIGIFGESGSGKSTLVNLITGLIRPAHGSIKYENNNINDILGYYHNKIGYISQNISLMDDSIKNNIIFFSEKEIDNQKIDFLVKNIGLEKLINELPNGLDAIIGENAAKISGGQKQRIGIARALYNNPEFLILDESTNALDPETEKKIIEAIFSIKDIKNIIFISHKVSNLKYCDKIYKLSNGKIENYETC